MVKVQAHGDKIKVPNPAKPGQVSNMVNVIFIEEGRSGANKDLSDSSDLLSQAVGVEVGLSQVRTHTQPVLETELGNFPEGKNIDGLYINRKLYSNPQMRNQIDKPARMVDGKPTFFTTYFGNAPKEDEDYRISIDILATFAPRQLYESQIGATTVERSNNDGSNTRNIGANQSVGITSRTDGANQGGLVTSNAGTGANQLARS